MKKIVIKKEELFEEFLAIFSIGLTHCLESQLMNPDRAEEWLFSPSIALSEKALRKNNIGEDLRDAFEFASELGACYGADYFTQSVVEARDKFAKVIKDSIKKNKMESNDKKRQLLLDIGLYNN